MNKFREVYPTYVPMVGNYPRNFWRDLFVVLNNEWQIESVAKCPLQDLFAINGLVSITDSDLTDRI